MDSPLKTIDIAALYSAQRQPSGHPKAPVHVALSEVLSALSYALDLTEGQPIGHTIRSCMIGMRIAEELGLGVEERSALYYALLLKDAGCSSNAAKMTALFGTDDREVKPYMKFVDWHKRWSLAARTALAVGRGKTLNERLGFFSGIARTANVTRDLIAIRCERGAEIVRRLGFPSSAAEAVRSLDEHWNGMGYAEGLSGEDIPLLSRIANLAQTVEAFFRSGGVNAALRVARERRGTWFDPQLVKIVLRWKGDAKWWEQLAGPDATALVLSVEPGNSPRAVDDEGLDAIALAFAEIIDAKSPFTYRHSSNVAAFALAMVRQYGMDTGQQQTIHRAWGLNGHQLDDAARILCVADVCEALTADRPYRAGMRPDVAFSLMRREFAGKLCARAVDSLEACFAGKPDWAEMRPHPVRQPG